MLHCIAMVRFFACSGSSLACLCVADLAGHVVLIDDILLQKHVQAALVLRQRMSGYLVDERLQPLAPLLDETLVKDALIAAEGHLSFPGLSG